MKAFDLSTEMEKLELDSNTNFDINISMQQKMLKRQYEIQKEVDKRKEKNIEEQTGINQIEIFLATFTKLQSDIEGGIKSAENGEIHKDEVVQYLNSLNDELLKLQNYYSNSTIFLRIYDKKKCQFALQTIQSDLQSLESKLLPKKRFGFKVRKNKVETVTNAHVKNGKDVIDACKIENFKKIEFCGFENRENEVLILRDEDIESKDVLLNNIKNCTIKLLGSPNTLHITNVEFSIFLVGPVSTSIMIEKALNCQFYLACQQLRIHETRDTDFHLHVTSKAIIEDSTNVRFGDYNFSYKNLDKHFETSQLNRLVNNFCSVDDFNWLASDKSSPNWSILEDSEKIIENE